MMKMFFLIPIMLLVIPACSENSNTQLKRSIPRVFFITGASGSGKSTLAKLLRQKLSSRFFEIYDFDEVGVSSYPDNAWRQKTTAYWIEKASKNVQKGLSTIICGMTVPAEVLKVSHKSRVSLDFGFMKMSDDLIRRRLRACSWSEQKIKDNIDWAHHLEDDVKKQKSHKIIECSRSTSEQIADQVVEWILSKTAITPQTHSKVLLKDFDNLWSIGDPLSVERALRGLLPHAQALSDASVHTQLLSQIALAQALQKKIDDAHKTLDEAEKLLTAEQHCAQVRVLLERGRVFQQAEKNTLARVCFEKSFELSARYNLDYHTINAAHMIAIVADRSDEKIKWNQAALDKARSTKDARATLWLGPLYNNLGQNYMDAKEFEKALEMYKKALEYREKEKNQPNIRCAQWAIARALRALGRHDESLAILTKLLKQNETIAQCGKFDMPAEMFTLTRGWVYEEIAEVYAAKASAFAKRAYDDLSGNAMFKKTAPERLERLRNMQREK